MVTLSASIIDAARAAQVKWGVPASVTLAQYGLESAWGSRMPAGSNNPFGIKAKPGQPQVEATTRDIIHQQPFRKYGSIAEAFDDHGRLLATVSLYAPAMAAWRQGALEAGVRLMAQHYATDPHYFQSIMAIINGSDLARYDTAPYIRQPTLTPVTPPTPTPTPNPSKAPSTNWISVLIAALAELFRRK